MKKIVQFIAVCQLSYRALYLYLIALIHDMDETASRTRVIGTGCG